MRRFIYLDTDTLHSYIAQIYDGLVQTQETETQSSTSSGSGNEKSLAVGGDAKFKILGKGIGAKADFAYKHLKDTTNSELISDVQTKLLHDNAFDQLLEYLQNEKAFCSNNIGDFILIEDSFYILDLEYYERLFNNKTLLDFIKSTQESAALAQLEAEKATRLSMPNAKKNEIDREYNKKKADAKNKIKEEYDTLKKIIELFIAIIPYRRTLCISDNMVVLNDSYMRDNLDMSAFKYGGKIKVLGYITNKIGDQSNVESLPEFAQIGAGLNEAMLSFFSNKSTLNIIHPIAIYYE